MVMLLPQACERASSAIGPTWRLRDDRRSGRGWRRWRFGNWLRWFGFRFRFDWFRLYDGGRFLGHFGFRLRRRRDFGRDWRLLDPLCFHWVREEAVRFEGKRGVSGALQGGL